MEEKASKVQQWFRDNISTIAIAILCLVYILYGIVTITESGKTIVQIIAEGVVSFIMGFLIKSLFNAQGLSNGERSVKFLKTKEFYISILEKISTYQHYLPRFCEMENENMLKKNQTIILRSANLKYEDFINNKIDIKTLTKTQKKAYKKALNIKIKYINDAILLSDYQLSLDAGKDIDCNKKKYLRASNSKTLVIMLASAFLFGYFSIDPNKGWNWYGMIWSLVQVAYYLGIGAMQFFNGFNFITDTYRTAIIRKTNYLERFANMYEENPNQFKIEEKKEVKEEEKLLTNDGFKKLKKEIKSSLIDDLITSAENPKNAVQPILEPKTVEFSQIGNLNSQKKEFKEEHIKTFEEICNEHRKEKENGNN